MSPMLPAIKCGGGGVSRGVAVEDCRGSSSRGMSGTDGFAMDVDRDERQDGAATGAGSGGCVPALETGNGAGVGAEHLPGVHDSIHWLMPIGHNEEEVDLPDDDVAFSLRSMFTEAGGSGTSSSQAEASAAMDHAASRQYNDEAYARELDNKLEKKEIDADTVVEDPLAVAVRVNQKDNMSSMASGGSHMLVVEDLRTMEPVRVCSPAALGTEGGDGSRKRGAPRDTCVAGKKVKFLSEIMTRVYPRDNEDASAEEAVQAEEANTVAPQTVVSAGGNGACSEGVGSGQMQYPPGYQPRRQLSNAEKGKTPVVQEDPIV